MVQFLGVLTCELNFSNTAKDNINLKVESVDGKRASQCFAELEEQVERIIKQLDTHIHSHKYSSWDLIHSCINHDCLNSYQRNSR